MFKEARLSLPEMKVRDHAVMYITTLFLGRGIYDRTVCNSFENVLEAAASLHDGDRDILIYARDGSGCQAMLGVWKPDA